MSMFPHTVTFWRYTLETDIGTMSETGTVYKKTVCGVLFVPSHGIKHNLPGQISSAASKVYIPSESIDDDWEPKVNDYITDGSEAKSGKDGLLVTEVVCYNKIGGLPNWEVSAR